MKAPTLERLREHVNYDPNTGIFTRKNGSKSNRYLAGDVTGNVKNCDGYLILNFDSKSYQSHRMAWFHFYGEMPKGFIDHINGIRDDNRIFNLRDVSAKINAQNQTKGHAKVGRSKRPYSTYLGVSSGSLPDKWKATIGFNGKVKYLGQFDTELEAHNAYLKVKRELHEGCTI